jgi:S-adenosylmethionine synthetase
MNTYFTSESVAAGHPDKICDQVSDSIVDAALFAHPNSRVAVETLVTENRVVLAGEVTCPTKIPYKRITRDKIKALGYTDETYKFSYKSPIDIYIHEQSPDISRGVDEGGAGDQGMMFGYATDETAEFMPLPIVLAHKLVEKVDKAREQEILPFLRPDGKSEVKVEYKNEKPEGVASIVLAVPHDPQIDPAGVKTQVITEVVKPLLTEYKLKMPPAKNIIVNGTGKWEFGGPASDTGVTGRKIIVDTYGGMARHGGGCFSGKDPSKVDRSGAYACRYLAKNIVAAGLATRCEVRVAYVIGKSLPLDVGVECFNTERKPISSVVGFAKNLLDLSVTGIIGELSLRQPFYAKTAVYGHFGRPGFPWERVVV